MKRLLRPGGNTPVVTYSIMALCIVFYLAQWVSGGAVTSALLMDPTRAASEPWRLLTSEFLHSQSFLPHILFNMYALYLFGPLLEHFLGRLRFVALYALAGVGAGVANVLVYEFAVLTEGAYVDILGGLLQPGYAVGASGAIFGLMGALVVLRRPIGVNPRSLLIVVVLNLAITFFAPNIAWEGHLGGFGVGAAVAAVYLATRRVDRQRTQALGLAGIAIGLVILVIACVTASPSAYY